MENYILTLELELKLLIILFNHNIYLIQRFYYVKDSAHEDFRKFGSEEVGIEVLKRRIVKKIPLKLVKRSNILKEEDEERRQLEDFLLIVILNSCFCNIRIPMTFSP